MTTMSASDANIYCLAIAQLIPVFLIALYVIDNSWLGKIIENEKERIFRPQGKFSSLPSEMGEVIETTTRQEMKKIDDALAKLNLKDPIRANKEIDAERAQLIARRMATRMMGERLTDDFLPKVDNISARVTESRESLTAEFDTKIGKILDDYGRTALYVIYLGIGTEVVVLWGAIGLIGTKFSIAWGTAVTILIAGTLSVFTTDRMTWGSESKSIKFFRKYWPVVVIATAIATFGWILFSVSIIPTDQGPSTTVTHQINRVPSLRPAPKSQTATPEISAASNSHRKGSTSGTFVSSARGS